MSDRDFVLRPVRKERPEKLPTDLPVQATHAIDRTAPADPTYAILRISDVSFGFWRPRASKSWTVMPSSLGRTNRGMLNEGWRKRSKPAATAVRAVKRLPARVTASAIQRLPFLVHATCSFQNRECRMPFIQVADFRLDAECAEQPPSADPNMISCFSRIPARPVKLAGNASISGRFAVIAVEQVKVQSANLDLPRAQPDRVTGQMSSAATTPHSPAEWCDRQLSGIVVGEKGLLCSIFVEHLTKIALLVEQTHADHRYAQITGGF